MPDGGVVEAKGGRGRAKKAYIQSGLMVISPRGLLAPNPLLGMTERLKKQALEYARELGLTPSSRTKLSAAPMDHTDDKWDF